MVRLASSIPFSSVRFRIGSIRFGKGDLVWFNPVWFWSDLVWLDSVQSGSGLVWFDPI